MTAEAPSISARDLYDRLRGAGSTTILDVRDRDEFDAWHVDGPGVIAHQVPYVQFVAAQAGGDPTDLLPDEPPGPVVAVCGVGEASDETAAMLRDAGVAAENLVGGMAAWAALLVRHDVGGPDGPPARPADLTVVQYERPATGCLSYLVAAADEAVLVDPLHAHVEEYVGDLADRGLDLRFAVDTHVHADHLSGARALADRTGAEVVLPAGASQRGLDFDATLVDDGDTMTVGQHTVEVVHTPGHTTEHVSLAVGGLLCTGDTLFLDGVGRPDLEDPAAAREHAAALYETLHGTMFAHPDETVLAPGHVQPATVRGRGPYVDELGVVRATLSLVDLDEEAFVQRVTAGLPPRPANHDRIVEYNLGHATIDQSALQLELGPNNCAVGDAD